MISSAFTARKTEDPSHENDVSKQQRTPTKSYSPQRKYQFSDFVEMSHWDSRSVNFPDTQSASACSLCENEPSVFGDCQSSSGKTKVSPPPVCVDPNCLWNVCEDCSQSVCDECSDHEGSCLDCVDQCGLGCDISTSCDGPDGRPYENYPFQDSYSELFGDQAAQIFDSNGRLPQLSSDSVALESDRGDLYSRDIETLGFAAEQGIQEESSGSKRPEQSSQGSIPWPALSQTLEAGPTYHNDFSMSFPATGIEPAPLFSVDGGTVAETMASSSFAPFSPNPTREQQINSYRYSAPPQVPGRMDHNKSTLSLPPTNTTNLKPENAGKETPSPESDHLTQCQWANETGQPCGMIFKLGSDLHQHLKDAHSVKTEHYCRWIGCRFGILGSTTPHRYANSVERHTWGHSGHRPYKCPTCSEGFAAANVRDEHYANFHLRKKLFSCDICTHTCTSARNLKRHKDEMHKTERFQCEFCNANGKVRLFPRAGNLARHFRKCKFVLEGFPDAEGAAEGKIVDDWFPPGYRAGHQGMDRAKVLPPRYLGMSRGGRVRGRVGVEPGNERDE